MSDPEAVWLNLINIVFGSVILTCGLVLGATLFRAWRERSLRLFSPLADQGAHTIILSDLGVTMADGGEKIADHRE